MAAFAGSGAQGTSGDGGPAAQAAIGNPFGIAVSRAGDVYVTSDRRLRRIDPSGRISTVFVAPSDTGPITVDAQGNVFFTTATRIYRVDAATAAIDVYAGTGVAGGAGDGGPAAAAQLNTPHGLLIATDGALLVADTENNSVRRIDPLSRAITTVATSIAGGGMCHGLGGVPYVTDFSGHAVKRLDATGPTVIAGNGRLGSSGDGGPATRASLATPIGCAVDAAGNLYIAEGGDISRIRRVDPAGMITTLSRRR